MPVNSSSVNSIGKNGATVGSYDSNSKRVNKTGNAVSILQILGFDKCESNEIFTTKLSIPKA